MIDKMGKKAAMIAIAAILSFLVLLVGGLYAMGEFVPVIVADKQVVLVIRPGDSLNQIIRRLDRKGVLRKTALVSYMSVIRGDSGQIKAGEYILENGFSANDILKRIVIGSATLVSMTIPEGYSLQDIASRLEEKSLGSAAEFLRLGKDPRFIATLKLPVVPTPLTLEGFVYPDTYHFHKGVSEANLYRLMVRQFKKKVGLLLKQGSERNALSPYKVLILASIIEKETGVGRERPLISAVFHNRIAMKMRLASDPTVIYGIQNFDGNLKRIHLQTKTPYNTYRIKGLPPTPIANPGLASIQAAIAPAKVKYLYFVAKGDGTHYFSLDFQTHNRAVFKYQIRKHRKKGKS